MMLGKDATLRRAVRMHRRMVIDTYRKARQKMYLRLRHSRDAERLIVFFIDGPWQKGMTETFSGGGITSVDSICTATGKLQDIHRAEVLIATFTGERLDKFYTFNSENTIIHHEDLSFFRSLKEVLIHVPECRVTSLFDLFKTGNIRGLLPAERYYVNILNQNIDLMPPVSLIHELSRFCSQVTQTTAHRRYFEDGSLDAYDIPAHHFSTRLDPSQYAFVPYAEKENLILFSPDDMDKNKKYIALLSKCFPHFEYRVISGLLYEDYKKLIGRAKFCFTFGEGLDGYFVESFFSGSICFAIYNERFFTPDQQQLPSVFASEEALESGILSVLQQLEDVSEYSRYVAATNEVMSKVYNFGEYTNNIRDYYLRYFKVNKEKS